MFRLLTPEVQKVLTLENPEHTLVITVGNCDRTDDGVGPYIASLLKEHSAVQVIDAGITPENCIDQVAALQPRKVFFIDAADFGGKAGEVRVLDPALVPPATLSTHSVPLSIVARLIEEDTRAQVLCIGIQPKSVNFGEGLSREVKEAAEEIYHVLCDSRKSS